MTDGSNERPVDLTLVRRLVDEQFPQWAHLPIAPVASPGWNNHMFRLGDGLLVRLPDGPAYAPAIEAEQRWLPWLAERLTLDVPRVVGAGRPDALFPHAWSVLEWIDGETVAASRDVDLSRLATDLARFLNELHGLDATEGPVGTERAGPLEQYDAATREAIERLGSSIDGARAAAVWEEALAAAPRPKRHWYHGDVAAGNLLIRDGRLAAVIDFGCTGVGDPSLDTTIAWTLFDRANRRVFREALGVDDASWARGRGLALWKGLIVISGMCTTNAVETAASPRAVAEALADAT